MNLKEFGNSDDSLSRIDEEVSSNLSEIFKLEIDLIDSLTAIKSILLSKKINFSKIKIEIGGQTQSSNC